jgi:hypothetical protein
MGSAMPRHFLECLEGEEQENHQHTKLNNRGATSSNTKGITIVRKVAVA